jgi:hypothetical protein
MVSRETLVFALRHPRHALCDHGIWKCSTHPRLLWRAEDRRWAWRHRLRAARIASWRGWTQAELDAMLAPQRATRAALLARLAADLRAVIERERRGATLERLLANSEGFAPWQIELLRQMLGAENVVVGLPWGQP